MKLLQRDDSTGYPVGAGQVMREGYGPIPNSEEFQNNHYGYEKPVQVHGWQWSTTFECWRALVTFADGWHGYTYPKPY